MIRANYKRIGGFIRQAKVKNTTDKLDLLLGININKYFMPSVANIVGTDLSRYKVVKPEQFACNRMHVGRDYRLPVALSKYCYDFIVSPAYDVFEIIDKSVLIPEYLMMWFARPEFDRNAWFYTDTDVRGKLGWDSFCDMLLPVPSIEKQREIVKEYNTIVNRIKLNEQLNQKLEETAQAIYKHWFVDFEFPDENGQPYKSMGGKMVWNDELVKEIPETFDFSNLGYLLNTINGYAFKSDDLLDSGELPIVKIKNIVPPNVSLDQTQFFSGKLINKIKKVSVSFGDILISMTGSGVNQINSAVGQVGRYYNTSIALINQRVCKLEIVNPSYSEYVYQFISNKDTHTELLNGSTGSANQANISPDQIKSLNLLIPNDLNAKMFQNLSDKIRNSIRIDSQTQLLELKDLILSKMTKVEAISINNQRDFE